MAVPDALRSLVVSRSSHSRDAKMLSISEAAGLLERNKIALLD
jgi:hypothetical protein